MTKRPTKFAQRLVAWREAQHWTNAALAEHLSAKMGLEISARTVEHFIQGRRPHLIWRKRIEELLPPEQN